MRRLGAVLVIMTLCVQTFLIVLSPDKVGAYTNSRLMDDDVFDAYNSMSEQQIRSFINSRSGTCLAGTGNIFPEPKDYFSYGPNLVDPARVIYVAAQYWKLNPQVIIATLQKEQSLLTDNDCFDPQGFDSLNKAMGYGCFEGPGAECPLPQYAGFHQQVMKGAWQLKFNKERAIGNVTWNSAEGDQYIFYNGPYTEGNRQDNVDAPSIYRDGYWLIDGQNVKMETGATASLYRYTPHLGQSFPSIFESWFGSTLSDSYYSCVPNGSNIGGQGSGGKVFGNRQGSGPELFSYGILNQTGTGCVEVHTWTHNLQGWLKHTATNTSSINPADNDVVAADLTGNGVDELYQVAYRNTGSNKIEFHRWDKTYQHWIAHVASNRNTVDPAASDIISADLDGNGQDEMLLVQYTGTSSGKIEVHGWTHNLQGWFLHAATNYNAVSKAQNRVIAADFDGNGRDELLLVNYQGTNSGKIEVHGWTLDFQSWFLHSATNHAAMNPGNGLVTPVNYNGIGRDELFMVRYQNTGSGRIEVHGWTFDLQGWFIQTAVAP